MKNIVLLILALSLVENSNALSIEMNNDSLLDRSVLIENQIPSMGPTIEPLPNLEYRLSDVIYRFVKNICGRAQGPQAFQVYDIT